jgi:hypothetical protein
MEQIRGQFCDRRFSGNLPQRRARGQPAPTELLARLLQVDGTQ